MAEPVDPLLPSRLRRLAFIVRNERLVAGAWFRAAQRLTDSVRPTVMGPYDSSRGTLPPDSSHAFGTATQSLWDSEIDEQVMPIVRSTVEQPWNSTMSAAPVGVRRSSGQDPYVVDYLTQSRNRLRNFPNELYARLQSIIANALGIGSSIPDTAAEVRRVLTVGGNEAYRNRATTVARTEVIGATNAGAFAGARALAEVTGDPAPEKIWLATDDSRTRETHRVADGQRVPLAQSFLVGGFPLQFPGDPTGPPQEVINCRCTILSVTQGEELDWSDRQFRQSAEDVWAEYDLEQDQES